MKNGSKNKLLTCFKPVVIDPDDHTIIDYSSDDQVFLAIVSDRKLDYRRSFSGAFKSVLYQSSLSRKFRENKIRRSKSHSDTISLKARADAILKSPKSSSYSYPNSSSGSDNLGIFLEERDDNDEGREVEEPEEKEEVIVRKSSVKLNNVMYLVVISLLVTILWGKLSAVTVTTVWIFVVRIVSRGLNLKESALVGFLRKKVFSTSVGSWLKMLLD